MDHGADSDDETTRFHRLKQVMDRLIERILVDHPGLSAASRWTRDKVHDRDALRKIEASLESPRNPDDDESAVSGPSGTA